MGALHIGTSGFVYPHWRDIFYPPKLPARLWLDFFTRVFTTCELNNTFYRLPKAEAVDRWRDETPPGFIWAAKGSRFLTHMKRLLETGEGITRYFDVVRHLGPKLGPVLWQLPPSMNKPDVERLDRFLAALPKDVHHAVEFRSDAWYRDEVCEVLDLHGAAFVEHDLVRKRVPRPTGWFRYLRFHGATGKYAGRYGKRALRKTAQDLLEWRKSGGDAYVYFNNDLGGHAISDALDLLELVGHRRPEIAREAEAMLAGMREARAAQHAH